MRLSVSSRNQRSTRFSQEALVGHFLEQACRRLRTAPLKLKGRHVEALQRNHWPGNVRELQNAIERAVIGARSGRLEFDLPSSSSGNQQAAVVPETLNSRGSEILSCNELKCQERENLRAALEETHWRISGPAGAAKLLGLKTTTLTSKIKALRLREE